MEMLKIILRKLMCCSGNGVYYIGGSDVLPPPLKGEQEQSALEALERGEEQAKQSPAFWAALFFPAVFQAAWQ